ncbi:hypothetical protein B1218_38600, partial [Pseudomonas ogarae]
MGQGRQRAQGRVVMADEAANDVVVSRGANGIRVIEVHQLAAAEDQKLDSELGLFVGVMAGLDEGLVQGPLHLEDLVLERLAVDRVH